MPGSAPSSIGDPPRTHRENVERKGAHAAGKRVENSPTPEAKRLPTPDSRRAKRAKLGRVLLDAQMWCFGRDVVRPSGNVLVAYGFSKERPPEGMNASSCYVRREDSMREIRLWGFGAMYSEACVGSLFLERRKFSPKLLANGHLDGMVWRLSDMPPSRKPRSEAEHAASWRLLGGACGWLSRYEAWVRSEYGGEYRRRCIASWPKKAVPADGMAESWMELARYFGGGEPTSASRFERISR